MAAASIGPAITVRDYSAQADPQSYAIMERPRPVSKPESSIDHRIAQRFPVHIPVRVKIPGTASEIVYSTRDVSHRGVFLYTKDPLPEHSPIEFTMKLKAPGAPEDGIQVLCNGTVVRVEMPVDGEIGMAATIDSYRFVHSKKANA